MLESESAMYQSLLVERRARLESLQSRLPDSRELEALLGEVDDALERLSQGSYGLCDYCHDPIEKKRLAVDPLIRLCLDHLTSQQRRALEEDLETAQRVQSTLLPQRRQEQSGWEIFYTYEPAGVVSGDYCDVVAPDAGRHSVYVLLGDVAGKGVSASLLMSHLHAMFRLLAATGEGLPRMLERANRQFCESTQPSHYATLVGVEAQPSGELAVCNAGHCPPLLASNGSVSPISATGLPLGLFCGATFQTSSFRLEPGDTLLLYSDGLVEATNRHDEPYGIERLASILRAARAESTAEALTEACLRDWKSFLGGAQKSDDLTLMVVRRL